MMQWIVFFTAGLFVFNTLQATQNDDAKLGELRKLYIKAAEDKKHSDGFYAHLKRIGDSVSPVVQGYSAMAAFLKSRDSRNPLNKLRHFNRGKEMLQKAFENAPQNIELTYLRLTIQVGAPSFLNYNDNVQDDKTRLLAYLKKSGRGQAETNLRIQIVSFLEKAGICSKAERVVLQNARENLAKEAF